MSMDDIFSQFGDVFGGHNPFESFFGGGSSGRSRVHKGSNLRIKLKLTLEEIAHGVEKKIKVKRMVMAEGVTYNSCPTCSGQGQVRKVVNTMIGQMVSTSTCPHCAGTGKIISNRPKEADQYGLVMNEEIIPIKIPAGVIDGMQLSMGGKGNDPPFGGVGGDLLIVVEEKSHEIFTRDGNNLVYDLYISIIDAALGAVIEIPTLDGNVKIKIDQGTQPGKILRLRGKGIKDIQGYGHGDQLVHVNVWIPKSLSAEEKILLENLRVSPNFKPNPGENEKGFFDKMKEFFH